MTAEGGRQPTLLFRAIDAALSALTRGQDVVGALVESFSLAMAGLGAQKGLLLYVRTEDPLDLEILHAEGLTPEQQEACVRMESTPAEGVSPSVIREALSSRAPVYIPNAADATERWKTTSLAGGAHSVLCAPVLDGSISAPIAVLYFQSSGVLQSFEPEDHAWLTAYATTLSQGLGLHLSQRRRIVDLERRGDKTGPVIVGESPWTERLIQTLWETFLPAMSARTPRPILLLGDSGTGKERIARFLHYYSSRGEKPFVALNCAELTRELGAARLFGHKRGAFTGAVETETGLFRAAHGGVLFLDEIGDMPLDTQALLLRVIETHEVQPVGDTRSYPLDVQLLLATHRDLRAMVKDGSFRHDLHARISGLRIQLLPLAAQERRGDVRVMLSYFFGLAERNYRKKTGGLTTTAFNRLLAYPWPSNVREVASVCDALVLHCREGAKIDLADIEEHYPEIVATAPLMDAMVLMADDMPFDAARAAWLRELLLRRYDVCDKQWTKVASSLAVPLSRVRRLREQCGLLEASAPSEESSDE